MPKHALNNLRDTLRDDDKSTNDERIGLTEAFAPVAAQGGMHAGGFSYQGDNDEECPDVCESLEPVDTGSLLFDESGCSAYPEPSQGKHGKKNKQPIAPYQRKSRRMRRILIVLIVLLILLIGALGYFAWQWFEESQIVANQQVHQNTQEVDAMQQGQNETKDVNTVVAKKTSVPSLVSLFGLTKSDAIAVLEHGATETGSKEVKEEGNPVKTNVTVMLTDEPADTRSGTPTVYLGLNEDGLVVQAGYSAAVASLGYGPFSFKDIVQEQHIVENTLQEAGIKAAEEPIKLPDDKTVYSEYASDKKTLIRETYSFSGTAETGDVSHGWSSVLLYDYTAANMSSNLADTIRIIYIYINA